MTSHLRPPFSAAFLAVYLLTNLVGPRLHHHAHEANAAKAAAGGPDSSSGSAAVAPCDLDDDDGHDCAVCAALAQVQTTAVVFRLAVVVVYTGEVVQMPAARPALPLPGLIRVRGPPSV